jgi:F-type H+-transporting ATPase subunit delta
MVAKLIEEDSKFRLFIETPRIDDADKKNVIKKAFEASLPKHVVNFVLITIDKRRQRLLRSISQQYQVLFDAHIGREHVQVKVARPADDATREVIAEKLSVALGKEVIPNFRVDAGILGGLVVRTGDTIYDGSIRRRLEGLRRRLLAADLPTDSGEAATA